MNRWTPSPPQSLIATRWQSRAEILKKHLDSLSPAELRRVRPDYYWLCFRYEAWKRDYARKANFNPNQPRVPAGNPDGGQWTSEGGGITDSRVLSDAAPDPIAPGMQFAADGHHYVPRGVFEKDKYSFGKDTLQVLEDAATGPLHDPTSNWFDEPHRQYNRAVEEALDRYLERNNIRGNQMTPDQARSFVDEIRTSRDPRIRGFNMRLWMRELQYWLRRAPRGRE
jgi:hypothetical protein